MKPEISELEDVDVKHAVQQFVYLDQRKRKSVNYTVKSFEKKFLNWLNEYFSQKNRR